MKNILMLFICLMLCGCNSVISDNTGSETNNNVTDSIDVSGYDLSIKDSDKNPSYLDGERIELGSDDINITKGGTYILSGSGSGTVTVDAQNDNVFLILDNVNIETSDFAAIYIKEADRVTIILEGDNYLSDSSKYLQKDDNDVDGVIFSKADLVISGEGSLNITASYDKGIVSKDDLIITGGDIEVNTTDGKGIVGKDCVKLCNADITVNSNKDAISSDNDEDEYRGYVYIESGNININTCGDGIYAYNLVHIVDGDFDISTSLNDNDSIKGIKSDGDVVLMNGTYSIDSDDDGIHSNGNVTIENGTYTIVSGDDGIHADGDVVINGGSISINDSYEGIEGKTVTINNGDIYVMASDDGINAAGGSDGDNVWDFDKGGMRPDNGMNPQEGMKPGRDMAGDNGFKSSKEMLPEMPRNEAGVEATAYISSTANMMDMGSNEYSVVINGGNVTVNANGDGIDSNGSIIINGGNTLVYGPSNSGNAALDYGTELLINGGNIIALGNGSMQEGVSPDSTQGYLLYGLNSYGSDEMIEIYSGDKLVLSTVSKKSFNSIIVSFEGLSNGDSLTVKIGNDSYEFTAGQSNSMGMTGGKGFRG
ncbi:MAG: carbohydrate-binding domain-containing protein [Erysipelotrichaceae bacterium]